MSGYGPEADSRPTVKTELTFAGRTGWRLAWPRFTSISGSTDRDHGLPFERLSFQDPARAVHAIGVRAQAPMGSGDFPPQAGPGRHELLPDPLTERELVVLQLLRGSLSRRDIAAELRRSPNTTQTQTQAIYRKLGVSTRRAAITRGLEIINGGGYRLRWQRDGGSFVSFRVMATKADERS